MSHFLWPLVGLAIVLVAAWRVRQATARAREMRAAREAAAAIALAEAMKAAQQAKGTRVARPTGVVPQAPAVAAPAPAAGAPAAMPARPAPGSPEAVARARAEADRIVAEARLRRDAAAQRAQKLARVEAERRAVPPAILPPVPAAPATPVAQAAPAAPRVATPAPAATSAPIPAPAMAPVAAAPRPAPVPVTPSPAAAPAPVVARAPRTPANVTVLMVDDSKMVRVKTSRLLEAAGYRVVPAVDGADALRQVDTTRVDLVITDADMPNLDGFGLTRALRAATATATLPVVLITSAEDRHRDEAARLGIGLVLGKPYPEDTLLAFIADATGVATPALAA